MVKLRAGKKKQAGVKDSAVVSSEFKKVHRLPSLPHLDVSKLRTKRGMTIVVLVILLIAALTGFTIWRIKESRKPVVTKIQTEQEFVSSKLAGLEGNAPASNSPKQERLQYYDRLQNYYELAGDYKKAAETFEKRATLESSDLDYQDFGTAARYYSNIGDKVKALAAIDKAISLLPPAANEQSGYDPVIQRQAMEQLKMELQK